MLKKIIGFTLLNIILFSTGCTSLLGVMGEYKKPQRETSISIKEYVGENKNYDGLFVIRNDALLKYFVDSVGNTLPNLFIFNKNRKNIYQSKTCVWSNINQLDSLQSSELWNIKPDVKIENIEKAIKLIDGNDPRSEYDFIIYYVWVKYTPRLTKNLLAAMGKDFKDKKINIYVGSVNLDLQKN